MGEMNRIGIIGMGKMGEAIAQGTAAGKPPLVPVELERRGAREQMTTGKFDHRYTAFIWASA